MEHISLPPEAQDIVKHCNIIIPESRQHLLDLALESPKKNVFDVTYNIPNKTPYTEAQIVRCKNGLVVNFVDSYMRRRDPDAMVIADNKPSDKSRYSDRFQKPFDPVRTETFQWLKDQKDLILLPFYSGQKDDGYGTALLAPMNAAFFAAALSDIQGLIPAKELPAHFSVQGMLYLAPPFRHTHFDGKQIVVHNRLDHVHELFCYNLYPGPSAKKGVYSILLNIGEKENWTTLHSAAVRIITPYDNEFVILHEGASGGGKSEMAQAIQRSENGSITLAQNTISGTTHTLELRDTCELQPVSDDMSLAHPKMQVGTRKLVIRDAEAGWFLRVNHLDEYGKSPQLEKICISPPEPLIFLNIDAKVGSTALIWEHIEDKPNVPCPNPRVIMPRNFVQGIVDTEVSVDIRSFGVRTPPCTKEKPDYGIIGMIHILPPSLAWLWRLVAPRGHANPSIIGSNKLESEGVGSYWPFATGTKITHANILLEQIRQTPETGYVLIPNQFIGSYYVDFSGEWIVREYLARRGNSSFDFNRLHPSRCSLLGYSLPALKVNGQSIPEVLLDVEKQIEVGRSGYDAGAAILKDFFVEELKQFRKKELHPVGRAIIDICLHDGSLKDYCDVLHV